MTKMPILASQHVASRIEYKITLLTYKSLVLMQPVYLHELQHVQHASRGHYILRNKNTVLLWTALERILR